MSFMSEVLLSILVVSWVLSYYLVYLVATRQEIRDANGDLYMTRYFLFGGDPKINPGRFGRRIYLHHFHRSDHDRALHDHPWSFTSLILWGGYREHADIRDVMDYIPSSKWDAWVKTDSMADYIDVKPLSIVRRPAAWRHRVELYPGKKAWTLVFIGKKERTWGFWIDFNKFCPWRRYDTRLGICEDGQ